MIKKPPVGLRPKKVAQAQYRAKRIDEIVMAIDRYSLACPPIPIDWVVELQKLMQEQHHD